ncbi:uncharacterized protein [Oryza sativa Japonica Group]|uniref:Os02g0163400 protein n=5 Tax=Oryza TaxID=4527 RepID=A0A0P0VF82_ORYSJ|nr:uncharacterized protein LOC4328398 [Oryza sativa Japonica Group]XP_052144903.1 uncharacterized protein LOC127764110 [Oryza glaberrima]KAB8085995.1 hypothetical protein EE612_009037 [Oryza sativa]KAF2943229.1 hypothetical protein DAI22_02g050400 [Oryza sativa Japonica Group]BAD25154.1 unknown protein [Oryza sativa Japonica Group]BAF07899.1 Os02g0163400 [Oryza sativa Japonica Group]BAS77131.1 Os02g0163400 [Oryza sativa Japonica Group]|eukprot:NP_001045985.1 Os02g0163400 [Oryza sativa Japonica Group]
MPAFSRARGAVLRVLDGLKRRPPASGAADTMSPVRKIQMLEEELRPSGGEISRILQRARAHLERQEEKFDPSSQTPELFRNGAGWQLNTFFLCLFSSIIANYKYNKVD